MASSSLPPGGGIGEAIAVSMVCGGIGNIPNPAMGFAALLTPVLTLSSAFINKSEALGAFRRSNRRFSQAAPCFSFSGHS